MTTHISSNFDITVTVYDDRSVDPNETVTLLLTTDDEGVYLSQPMVNISITDTGKL